MSAEVSAHLSGVESSAHHSNGICITTIMVKIANRLQVIANHTGHAGLSDDMAEHFRQHVKGLPKSRMRIAYIDEEKSVIELLTYDKIVLNPDELLDYANSLVDVSRHARAGREPFDEYMSNVVGTMKVVARQRELNARNYDRHRGVA